MAAQGTRGLRPQLLCMGALSSSCLAARRSGTGFCTPCAPGQYWSKLGTQQLMEAPTPQTWCPEQELLQAGAGTNLEGSQRRTREDAVTWLSCSPFRNGPGGGSVLRRQRGQCEVLTWLQALSSQVRVQPTGSTSPGTRRAAFKVCVCVGPGWLPCLGAAALHPLSAHLSCQGTSCMRLLPALLGMLWGRKAPGCSSPTWQALRSASSMLLPAPSTVE